MLIDLAEPQHTGAVHAPTSAATQAPAPPAAVRTGAQSSSPSSEAMCGLDRGPLNSAAVHNDAQYEDVYADEDGWRGLVSDLNENAWSNELRVQGVQDLNGLHAINGLGTNDDLLNVGDDFSRENEIRVRV